MILTPLPSHFFENKSLCGKALGGKKVDFLLKPKVVLESRERGWHHGPKVRRISKAGRATEETTSLESHRKSIATKTHIRFFEVSSFFLQIFLNSDLDRSDH